MQKIGKTLAYHLAPKCIFEFLASQSEGFEQQVFKFLAEKMDEPFFTSLFEITATTPENKENVFRHITKNGKTLKDVITNSLSLLGKVKRNMEESDPIVKKAWQLVKKRIPPQYLDIPLGEKIEVKNNPWKWREALSLNAKIQFFELWKSYTFLDAYFYFLGKYARLPSFNIFNHLTRSAVQEVFLEMWHHS